jgi:hypothetical protein
MPRDHRREGKASWWFACPTSGEVKLSVVYTWSFNQSIGINSVCYVPGNEQFVFTSRAVTAAIPMPEEDVSAIKVEIQNPSKTTLERKWSVHSFAEATGSMHRNAPSFEPRLRQVVMEVWNQHKRLLGQYARAVCELVMRNVRKSNCFFFADMGSACSNTSTLACYSVSRLISHSRKRTPETPGPNPSYRLLETRGSQLLSTTPGRAALQLPNIPMLAALCATHARRCASYLRNNNLKDTQSFPEEFGGMA